MEAVGFVFGLAGLSFALIVKEKLSSLHKEFDELKKELIDSGIIKEKAESAKK